MLLPVNRVTGYVGPRLKVCLPCHFLCLLVFFFFGLCSINIETFSIPSAFTRARLHLAARVRKTLDGKRKPKKVTARLSAFSKQITPHRRASTRPGSVKLRCQGSFRAWLRPGLRQRESTILRGLKKPKPPWRRPAIDLDGKFPTRAGSSLDV